MLTFFLSSTHQLDILLVMIQTTEALLFQLKRQGYRNPQTKIHAVLCRIGRGELRDVIFMITSGIYRSMDIVIMKIHLQSS